MSVNFHLPVFLHDGLMGKCRVHFVNSQWLQLFLQDFSDTILFLALGNYLNPVSNEAVCPSLSIPLPGYTPSLLALQPTQRWRDFYPAVVFAIKPCTNCDGILEDNDADQSLEQENDSIAQCNVHNKDLIEQAIALFVRNYPRTALKLLKRYARSNPESIEVK